MAFADDMRDYEREVKELRENTKRKEGHFQAYIDSPIDDYYIDRKMREGLFYDIVAAQNKEKHEQFIKESAVKLEFWYDKLDSAKKKKMLEDLINVTTGFSKAKQLISYGKELYPYEPFHYMGAGANIASDYILTKTPIGKRYVEGVSKILKDFGIVLNPRSYGEKATKKPRKYEHGTQFYGKKRYY